MRKTENLVIQTEGRDKGKTFALTEMSADAGERWALRMLLALTNTGAAIPEEALQAGMAGLAAVGIQAIGMLQADVVQPLLDELWDPCVRYIHSPKLPAQEVIRGTNSQIEEVGTRLQIYKALLKLHTGFSLAANPPTTAQDTTSGEKTSVSFVSSISRALLQLWSRVR